MNVIKSIILWLLKICFRAVIVEVSAEIENREEEINNEAKKTPKK